jgi:hypothetical protein
MPTNGSTPNFNLVLPHGNRQNWTDLANGNFRLIDAILSTFVSVTNLLGLWTNNTVYTVGDNVVDEDSGVVYTCQVDHTSPSAPDTFLDSRTDNPTYWTTFSVAARARGAWTTATAYAVNDFVVSVSKYAVCIQAHTSGVTFDADQAAGKWQVLVDLSAAGSLVLPILSGAGDASKFVTANPAGTAYIVNTMATALQASGASVVGTNILAAATAAAVRSILALGTAALLDAGTGANNLVQLDATPKLPAVNGSQLTNLPGSLSSTTFLASDIAFTTAGFTDLANTGSIGAAGQVWLLIGQVSAVDTSGGTNAYEIGIFNGSVYICNTVTHFPAANIRAGLVTCAIVTLAAATTFTLRAKTLVGNATAATTGGSTGVANKATGISAVRLA